MKEQPGRVDEFGLDRFDAETVRRILQRAAEEQHRLETEFADSYSLEELEEMASETGISPEALRVAIEAQRRQPRTAAAESEVAAKRPKGLLASLERLMPDSWSPTVKRTVLTSTGVIGLFWILLSLPGIGPVVFWAAALVLIVLSLLLLLGVGFV
jgi:hypothetical protein